MWHPDTTFISDANTDSLESQTYHSFQQLYSNGDVLFSVLQKKEFSCTLDWKWYPFDSQTCMIIFGSHGGLTVDKVIYQLPEDPLSVNISIGDPEYKLEKCSMRVVVAKVPSGNAYSVVGVRFVFKRVKRYFAELFVFPMIFVLLSFAVLINDISNGAYFCQTLMIGFLLFVTLLFRSFPISRDSVVFIYLSLTGCQMLLILVAVLFMRIFFSDSKSASAETSSSFVSILAIRLAGKEILVRKVLISGLFGFWLLCQLGFWLALKMNS